MTLVNLNDVLLDAKKRSYAVGAFNFTDISTARGIVSAAEKLNAPVVLQFAQSHLPYMSLEEVGINAIQLAKKASVPVVVHLDHGEDVATAMKALKMGFSSVMLDFSLKPFKENVKATKEVVEIAHDLGASVEGEIGVMTRDDGEGMPDYSHLTDKYTKVEDAKRFYDLTHVDALAVSFGTVHGIYREKPHLNFERLHEISEALPIPLVMHGGSGLSDEEYRESIKNGITKINYYSVMSFNVVNGLRDYLNARRDKQTFLYDCDMEVIRLVEEDLMKKIKIFGSTDTALVAK
ncbi:class II fructose-bisphosphate aldolase [Lacticaseibacillus paracasei]|uniref:class II fructose-bisphosphate aldolase n=1 Tax=Lacticaseibacillus paracasei TaxID=1597 RepID=UPI00235939DB|nr:class II fructose-bisphosphate aldolase [Lacticaseibacillus paracasei]WCZ18183.1 class II fructose-bisphosphate aldolase [Lacticaseibacillus paracasei]